jgi:hypothetical protein
MESKKRALSIAEKDKKYRAMRARVLVYCRRQLRLSLKEVTQRAGVQLENLAVLQAGDEDCYLFLLRRLPSVIKAAAHARLRITEQGRGIAEKSGAADFMRSKKSHTKRISRKRARTGNTRA